jgi:nicotinamide riboside transporter PnuC
MDNFIAAGIFIFGSLALLLVSLKNKWGFVIGLIGQLFFLIASYADGLRGLFFFSIIQTFIWIYGIYNWFYKNKKIS